MRPAAHPSRRRSHVDHVLSRSLHLGQHRHRFGARLRQLHSLGVIQLFGRTIIGTATAASRARTTINNSNKNNKNNKNNENSNSNKNNDDNADNGNSNKTTTTADSASRERFFSRATRYGLVPCRVIQKNSFYYKYNSQYVRRSKAATRGLKFSTSDKMPSKTLENAGATRQQVKLQRRFSKIMLSIGMGEIAESNGAPRWYFTKIPPKTRPPPSPPMNETAPISRLSSQTRALRSLQDRSSARPRTDMSVSPCSINTRV